MSKDQESLASAENDVTEAKTSVAPSEDVFADFNFQDLETDINLMFKNGVYFGHQKSRKNPKMQSYIFGTKNGINIIDLQKTVEKLKEAQDFIEKIVSEGQDIMFVGTKKQAKRLIESAAKKCTMPYVVDRWLGGTFTNFGIISKRTKFLRESEEKMKQGEFAKYTKFEQMKMKEELEKMNHRMGGIKNMLKLPGAIFVTGVNEDNLAIKEAQKRSIPIIGLVDTNVDPEVVNYPIPANEDAVSSLKLMIAYIIQAVERGKEKRVALPPKPISEKL